MSAQGAAPRAALDLKVKVWGMGGNNQPFFQNAIAQNISATGACIYGIEPELKVGDVIGVQYEGRKARCKVMWVVDAGAQPALRPRAVEPACRRDGETHHRRIACAVAIADTSVTVCRFDPLWQLARRRVERQRNPSEGQRI